MATLHVICDPNDKIVIRPEDNRRMGLSVATLSLPVEMSPEEMMQAINLLAGRLLLRYYGHTEHHGADGLVEATAIRMATGNNGGSWAEHYTTAQKDWWRGEARSLLRDLGWFD